jgi:hypothetical protein
MWTAIMRQIVWKLSATKNPKVAPSKNPVC